MSERILITGGTGFLGRHLVAHLRQMPGQPILRLLNYGPCPFRDLPGVEVIDGDIRRFDDVARAMEGCQKVYHLAGFVSRNPAHRERLFEVHVQGTRNVCEAALRYKPEKIVAVSSSGTIAVSRDPVPRDETAGYPWELISRWPYYLSKAQAEQEALRYARDHRLPIVIVNPALLLGPGDEFGSSTGDVALFLKGQVLATPRGGICFVDARDAAAALVAAMERGRPGERYLLGAANWTLAEFLQHLASLTGRRAPALQPPFWLARLSTRLLRVAFRLAGRRYELDDVSLEMAYHYWYCDWSKARRELGFEPRDPIETLRDTIQDLLSRGR